MNRREFFKHAGSASAAVALAESIVDAQVTARPAPGQSTQTSAPRARMKVGTQHGDSDAILRVMAGFGVNHICSELPSAKLDQTWSADALTARREHVASFGISLDMVPLPLSSSEIERSES